MVKSVLVLGGTKFFGRELVNILREENVSITVATRGNEPLDFGSDVCHVPADRQNEDDIRRLAENNYDVVYDQICFSSYDAKLACDYLVSKSRKYVFVSSQFVYPLGGNLVERSFPHMTYEVKVANRGEDVDYSEGKRLAEAYFYQRCREPSKVSSVRFPIVFGANDYTGRLNFYVDRINREGAIRFKNPEARISLISAKEAALSLYHLGDSKHHGPINISFAAVRLREFSSYLCRALNREAVVMRDESGDSPYDFGVDYYMDCSLADRMSLSPVTSFYDALNECVGEITI